MAVIREEEEEVNTQKGFNQERYEQLATNRSVYLEDAYRASELTIQFLLQRNANDKKKNHNTLKKQHQSIGSMGVNNLANKLVLTLLPPNQPFFKLSIDDFTAMELASDKNARSLIEQSFAAVENASTERIEQSGIRPPLEEALKHLIVCGNILVNRLPKGGLELFHMDQYVVNRDPDGKTREIVIEEYYTWRSLPDKAKAILVAANKETKKGKEDETIPMYTRILKISESMWQLVQEVKAEIVTEQKFSDEKNPWFALRFHSIKGSDWGRGYVHNFLGDLDTLEQLEKSFGHAAKMMAFILFLVRPGATVTPQQIIEKINGGFISANEGDVTVLQANKGGDLQVVLEKIDRTTKRLSKAFLMDEAIVRDAERVTAEEIRLLAQKLEESMGGFYSIFSQEFQVKFLQLTLDDFIKRGIIPPLPKQIVKPIIITGMDALGRNSEAERLRLFVGELTETLGEQVTAQIVNPLDYARRLGAARGVDIKGLVKTKDEMDADVQQSNQQQMVDKATGPMINQVGKVLTSEEGMANAGAAVQGIQDQLQQ